MNKLGAQLLLVIMSSSGAAWAQECAFSSERAANFEGPVRKVVVTAEDGALKIHGEATGEVKALGKACASSESVLGKIALESRRENDVVYLTVVLGGTMRDMFSFRRYASLDLDIAVPRDAELEITDSGGDLELSDVGAVRIKDGSGDQLLTNIKGNLFIEDSSGVIRAMSVAGNVEVDDGSDNIDIEDVRGDVKILGDGSGDIALAKVTGDVDVMEDGSGDITVREVKKNVRIHNDGSGDINVTDVGGNLSVTADSGGNILYERVSGSVRIPART